VFGSKEVEHVEAIRHFWREWISTTSGAVGDWQGLIHMNFKAQGLITGPLDAEESYIEAVAARYSRM
jgi:hypothetical protein